MTHDQLAKEFHILNGKHWHTDDNGYSDEFIRENGLNRNPTYSTAESVLKVMDKRKDSKYFYAVLMYGDHPNVEEIDDDGYIDRDYITEPDKLLTAVVEWCREHPLEKN